MNKKIFLKSIITSISGLLILMSCQDDFWADHYASTLTSNKNLMEVMENDTSLTHFVSIMKKTGYDKVVANSQTYTIWAPVNTSITNLKLDNDTLNHFIKNHIARFSISTADLSEKSTSRIKMLNGKAYSFTKSADKYTFSDANIIQKDIPTQNGVIHKIDNEILFFKNIWENIDFVSGNDSISKYLHSYDLLMFDPSKSTELGVGSSGVIYDSVFIYSNDWISKYGRIQNEDSVYTMFLPNNIAWTKAYNQIKPYFKTYDKLLSETLTNKTFSTTGSLADSLQRAYTCQAITNDLIFRSKSGISNDTLVSTSGNVLKNPGDIFGGSEKIESSNGLLYNSSNFNYRATDSWQKRIVVEAENSDGRTFNNSSLYTRVAKNEVLLPFISEKKYIELSPTATNPNFQPEIILSIPNTLSASYDIYCVIVPAYEMDTARTLNTKTNQLEYTRDSTVITFQMTYVDASGVMKTNTAITKDPVYNKVYETSSTKISKLLVAKGFKFPFANFSASPFEGSVNQTNTVTIKVKTNVNSTDYGSGKYTRNLRVDCIVLEPSN